MASDRGSRPSLSVDVFDLGFGGAVIGAAAGILAVYFQVSGGQMIPVLDLSVWITLAGTWYFSI